MIANIDTERWIKMRTPNKRNSKLMILSSMALLFVFFLSSCGKQSSPDNTVDTLFKSAKTLDAETFVLLFDEDALNEISDDIDEFIDTDNYIQTDDEDSIDYDNIEGLDDVKAHLKDLMSDLSYTIINTDEAEDTAIVTVDVAYVNGEELIAESVGDLFGKIMTHAFTNDDELTEEESLSLLTKIFNDNYVEFEKTLKEDTIDIYLVKDKNNDWVISELDYELMNALAFNFLEGVENILYGIFE